MNNPNPPGLSVIIPSKNVSNLRRCIQAINIYNQHVNVIVIDDGLEIANPLSGEFLKGCTVVRGVEPFVFARNVNLGIIAAGRDDVIVLNDDAMLATSDGFTDLHRASREQPEYGVVAAVTNVCGNPRQHPQQVHRGHPVPIRDEPGMVCFVCVLIPRRTINSIGVLDQRFTAYGWEDNDYCRRVRMAGSRIGIYDGCYVDHGSLTSTFRGDPYAPGGIAEGAAIYHGKWGDFE